MTSGPGSTSGTPGSRQKTTAKAILISIVAAVGGFLFGFDSSVINGAVSAIEGEFGLESNPLLSGFAVAVALLGSAVAASFAISSVLSGLAFAVWDLILWRFIAGVGIGIASVIAPAYIAEIAPAHIRGRLASLQQMAIVLGIFVALLSDALLAGV